MNLNVWKIRFEVPKSLRSAAESAPDLFKSYKLVLVGTSFVASGTLTSISSLTPPLLNTALLSKLTEKDP